VTYNLHVMLRFDLKLDLLEGLAVRELPEPWRARIRADFDLAPPVRPTPVIAVAHGELHRSQGHDPSAATWPPCIIPESRAPLSRNPARHHPGLPGSLRRNPHKSADSLKLYPHNCSGV
jgi:Carboxypeptidase Taq (M32) metallopeptidase